MTSNTTDDQLSDDGQIRKIEEYEQKLQSTLEDISTHENEVAEKYQQLQAEVEVLRKVHTDLAKQEREFDEKLKQLDKEVKSILSFPPMKNISFVI